MKNAYLIPYKLLNILISGSFCFDEIQYIRAVTHELCIIIFGVVMFTGLVQRIFIYDNIEDATLKPGTHYPHSQAVNAGHKHS